MDPRLDIQVKETRRNVQPVYHFAVNCLLYSRIEPGLVSNPECYDEDVDVYLAHLLHAFINPEYAEPSRKFLWKLPTPISNRMLSSSRKPEPTRLFCGSCPSTRQFSSEYQKPWDFNPNGSRVRHSPIPI